MKHFYSELYRIPGLPGLYDESYLDAYGVWEWLGDSRHCPQDFAIRCHDMEEMPCEFTVHTARGRFYAYTCSRSFWFDTEYECRLERAKRRETESEKQRKQAALRRLAKLDAANLEKLVDKLGL